MSLCWPLAIWLSLVLAGFVACYSNRSLGLQVELKAPDAFEVTDRAGVLGGTKLPVMQAELEVPDGFRPLVNLGSHITSRDAGRNGGPDSCRPLGM